MSTQKSNTKQGGFASVIDNQNIVIKDSFVYNSEQSPLGSVKEPEITSKQQTLFNKASCAKSPKSKRNSHWSYEDANQNGFGTIPINRAKTGNDGHKRNNQTKGAATANSSR